MKQLIILTFLFHIFFQLNSQNIAAFTDYQKHFYVFDDGNIRQLEHLPVISYKAGDKYVGYITNNNNFKIYYNNIDYDIGPFVQDYFVTNNLVIYSTGQQLYVFDNGKKRLLSKLVGDYYYGDSMVAYYDKEKYFFEVYSNGSIRKLADGLLSDNISSFKVGENILGFVDNYDVFKVFYQNKITNLFTVNNTIIAKFGLDIVAYIDPDTDYLQVFFKNEVIELETFRPKSFEIGYKKVAFVTENGDFVLFDNGEIYDISSYAPDSYELNEDILIYTQQGQFFAFCNGENYLIENYIPANYKVKYNSIAYIDQNGYLNLFKNGEKEILSYQKINDFEVMRNLVISNEGMNTVQIYHKGKTYTK
ncbi:MAG: hypothetical protein JEZ09_10465 [Salinivirgaceae bacterium]|nr:hypothetical protein [Salinivirgaceae bacterium]